MGLNMAQAFPSKYLSAADVTEQGIMFRVQSVTLEQVDQDTSKPDKPIVHFQGQDKGMVLNVTNNNTIISMYGADSDGWVGKDIILFKTHVDFQGRMVEAIRVRPGPPAAQAPAAGMNTPGPNYETGDPLNYEA